MLLGAVVNAVVGTVVHDVIEKKYMQLKEYIHLQEK